MYLYYKLRLFYKVMKYAQERAEGRAKRELRES